MRRDWRLANTPRTQIANPAKAAADESVGPPLLRRVAELASHQRGRVSRIQLEAIGVSSTQIARWVSAGILLRVLPGVYAVGHLAASFEADLTAAVLYAGPDAEVSHDTATWWLQLSERRPSIIDVTTPRRCKSLDGIRVHGRRTRERVWVRGLPTTSPIDTLLDVATTTDLDNLRYLLAQADYRRLVDLAEIPAALTAGRPGSATLRRALLHHMPQLARTRSRLEIEFLLKVCEGHGVPLPEVNVRLHGFTVDAVWRRQRVVVELDGGEGHTTRAQMDRDRRRDLALRMHGFIVIRYTWNQVYFETAAVAADLRQTLAERDARDR
jgi:Protein of unknown function (DUF559)/Transcriptional regulator, AbiEi antitoxin